MGSSPVDPSSPAPEIVQWDVARHACRPPRFVQRDRRGVHAALLLLTVSIVGIPLIPVALIGLLIGKLLAVAAEKRLPSHPDMPTVVEAGFPGFTSGTWFSIVTRAGTPRPVIERLSRASASSLAPPEVAKNILAKAAAEAVGSTPEEQLKVFEAEVRLWSSKHLRNGYAKEWLEDLLRRAV